MDFYCASCKTRTEALNNNKGKTRRFTMKSIVRELIDFRTFELARVS